jgi:hypothetical protein
VTLVSLIYFYVCDARISILTYIDKYHILYITAPDNQV